jgi:hypothetical protein
MLNKIVFRDNENDTGAGAAPRAGGRRRAHNLPRGAGGRGPRAGVATRVGVVQYFGVHSRHFRF